MAHVQPWTIWGSATGSSRLPFQHEAYPQIHGCAVFLTCGRWRIQSLLQRQHDRHARCSLVVNRFGCTLGATNLNACAQSLTHVTQDPQSTQQLLRYITLLVLDLVGTSRGTSTYRSRTEYSRLQRVIELGVRVGLRR